MSDESQPQVLAVSSLMDVRIIDGGDTLAVRLMKPGDEELVILVPRQVALALQMQISDVLAQPHIPRRFER